MAKERRFKLNRSYRAVFSWYHKGTCRYTTEFSGVSINKHGLKKLIYKEASRLELPRGYKCKIDG